MNRETLLNCVRRHLHDSFMENGDLRPIGEMVPRIAIELRSDRITPYSSEATVSIVPMQMVAAFVDGEISVDEENLICNAVMVDNSVLAEIIAALRALREFENLPTLSSPLTARLLAMQTLEPPVVRVASTVPPMSSLNSVELSSRSIERRARLSPIGVGLAVSAALAASICALFWNGYFEAKSQIADQPSERMDTNSLQDFDKQQVGKSADQGSIRGPTGNRLSPKLDIVKDVAEPLQVIPQSNWINESSIGVNPTKIATDRGSGNTIEPMASSESTHLSVELSGIRWTKISGLLAHRTQKPAVSTSVGASNWGSVEQGSREWDSGDDLRPIELRTLPLSRAEANLESGGKMVLASDTDVQLTRTRRDSPGRLDLHHGFVALLDIPKGTVVDLGVSGGKLATLRWESKASVVLGVTAAGLQAQIDGGEISIDEKPRKNTSVIIDRGNVTELKERVGRLPSWVARPTDKITMPKAILAQIASSDNLGRTLSQLLESQSSEPIDEQRASLISAWLASLVNENLFRQANARRPSVRIAALQRIVQTPEWDSRYAAIWSDIEMAVGDERKVMVFRNFAQLARQGGKPNAVQVNPLIALLDSPDTASRAFSDFLLRQLYGGGPIFDPTWTDEANARGTGLWRRFVAAATSVR